MTEDFKENGTVRVQVPNNHILAQSLYCNHYYPKRRYLRVLGPSGESIMLFGGLASLETRLRALSIMFRVK